METLAIPSEVLAAESISTLESEQAGTWRFCALVRGEEWNPSIFTRVLENCALLMMIEAQNNNLE